MAFNILSILKDVVAPVTTLIGDMHTSEDEKLQARNALAAMQNTISMAYLDYEARIAEMQGSIIVAEAQGQSWIQRNWRPITMLAFLALVICDQFGLLEFRLADQAWTLLQIGLGGYVVGRSAEKIVPQLVKQ